MMRSIIKSAPARTTAAIFLTFVIVFGVYSFSSAGTAWAVTGITPPAVDTCAGPSATFTVSYTVNTNPAPPPVTLPATAYYGIQTGGGAINCTSCTGCVDGSGGWGPASYPAVPAGTTLTATAGWYTDAGCTAPLATNSVSYNCSTGAIVSAGGGGGGGAAVEPPARTPAVWLADVCEPLEGFSADGWMTIDSDVWELPFDRLMYVAPTIDGPWMSIEMPGPPYIVNQETMNVIASVVGMDYHDVWIRISSAGQPARIGSMIIDRGWRMQALCGG